MPEAAPIERSAISFRPQTGDDTEFLYQLYATTRAEEMKLVDWSEQQKEAFVRMQFRAQSSHYAEHYPACAFLIIERNGLPIGRLCLDRDGDDFRIVDIALVPSSRGLGIGTMLMREILDEAAALGKPVTIHVESMNPARHLYDRLGFRHIDTNGVYHLMEWRQKP